MKFTRNHWGHGFYEVLFTIFDTNHHPWKTGTTQFPWVTNRFRKYQKTTEPMCFMRSLFLYFTQITPLKNGDNTLCIDYKEEFSKFATNHWVKGFYENLFQLFHTNHPLGKRRPHSLNGLQRKKKWKLSQKHWANGFYWIPFPLFDTIHRTKTCW